MARHSDENRALVRLWAVVRTPYPSHDDLRLIDLFCVALVMVGTLVFQRTVNNGEWTVGVMWLGVVVSMFITRRVIPHAADSGGQAKGGAE